MRMIPRVLLPARACSRVCAPVPRCVPVRACACVSLLLRHGHFGVHEARVCQLVVVHAGDRFDHLQVRMRCGGVAAACGAWYTPVIDPIGMNAPAIASAVKRLYLDH
jgi:hypothetical protein